MKLSIHLLTLIAASACLVTSCGRAPDGPAQPVAADWTADPGSTIKAEPNPVPAGGRATTISWNAGQRPTAAVYVTSNGAREKLFSRGAAGSSEAPWIQARSTYEFRLYSDETRKQLLARVSVTGTK